MNPLLLDYLCDPVDRTLLRLDDASLDQAGRPASGRLVTVSGASYPIIDGIPRFAMLPDAREAVESLGDEWNYLDLVDIKQNWLIHTIANTFGSIDAFKGRMVVDAGADSGSQSRWIAEASARLVIALEIPHSVDGVMRPIPRNVGNYTYPILVIRLGRSFGVFMKNAWALAQIGLGCSLLFWAHW